MAFFHDSLTLTTRRPTTAKGISYLPFEDECGLPDLAVKPPVYPWLREVMHYSALVLAQGTIQRSDGVISVLVRDLISLA